MRQIMRWAPLAILIVTSAAAAQVPGPRPERVQTAGLRGEAKPLLPEWLPYVLSAIAVGVSLSGFYFQWIHARGARVTLLNDMDVQKSAVRTWSGLPRNVQNDFPEYVQAFPGYALVRLVVVNTGDRPGYAKIESATVRVPWTAEGEDQRPRVSFYTYAVVPALAVIDKLIIVRNLPDPEPGCEISVHLKLRTGGPAGRFRPRLRTKAYDCTLPVELVASRLPAPAESVPDQRPLA